MWHSVRNWFDRQAVDTSASIRSASIDSGRRIQEVGSEMVETRSGRHASPSTTSNSGTPKSNTRSKPRKAPAGPLDLPVQDQDRVDDQNSAGPSSPRGRNELESDTNVRSTQNLAHRTKGLAAEEDEQSLNFRSPQDQIDVAQADQDFETHNVEPDTVLSPSNGPERRNVANKSHASTLDSPPPPTVSGFSSLSKGAKRKRGKQTADSLRSSNTTETKQHKRFASEDAEIPGALQVSEPSFKDSEASGAYISVSEESDDDAPEEVTVAVGAQAAKLKADKATQAAKSQRDSLRQKRQNRGHELKLQAEAARNRKGQISPTQVVPESAVSESLLVSTLVGDDDLPDELPESLLHNDPLEPPNHNNATRITKPNKRKRLDIEPSKYKDIKIGHNSVRVLPHAAVSLPPAVVRQSANIKEAWLKARAQESKKKLAGYRTKGAGATNFLRSR